MPRTLINYPPLLARLDRAMGQRGKALKYIVDQIDAGVSSHSVADRLGSLCGERIAPTTVRLYFHHRERLLALARTRQKRALAAPL